MGRTPEPLVVQRLLLAGLIALAALSALLLFLLRSGSERGRGTLPLAEQSSPAPLARRAPSAGPQAAAGGPEEARELRTALAPTAAPTPVEPGFDPAAITGRVLCAGAPVPEVDLFLFEGSLDRRERDEPLAAAKSDEHGRFRFHGVPHARYALLAQHPQYLPEDETVFAGHAQELELERAATVAGTVCARADGRPLAGVEVVLRRWHVGPDGMVERVSARSDAEGRWQLAWAEPGIETFEVLRPGRLAEKREFQVALPGGTGYAILLDDGRALELQLHALEDGALLADTEVLCDGARVRTDSHGCLLLPLPPAQESLRVTLALAGGCRTQAQLDPAALEAEGRALVRVPLARGGTVRGRVLDAADRPVEGVELRLSGGGRPAASLALPAGVSLEGGRGSMRSGADGRFELRGLPPREGLVEVRARHPDYPPGRSEPFAFARLGATAEVEIRLERGGTVTGTVRLDGEPASLRVGWEGARASGWTRSDDRGAYRIAGIPSGELRVGARLEHEEDEDLARPEDVLLFVEEGAELAADLELVSRLAPLRGRVREESGAPVAEADVWAVQLGGEEVSELHAESEADGSFELRVPEAAGLLFDLLARKGPRKAEASSVSAGPGEVELVMPVLVPVALRVVDALHHDPVQGFRLYWRDSDEGAFERLVQGGGTLAAGPDGAFVAELPAGRVDLVVSARSQGYVPARQDGIRLSGAGTPVVEFELERGVELLLELQAAPENAAGLRLLRRSRTAIATAEQWAESGGRGAAWFHQDVRSAQAVRPDENGLVRLEAMPAGRYRFFSGPKGFVFRPHEFDVPPVAQHRVTVALEPEPRKGKRGGKR